MKTSNILILGLLALTLLFGLSSNFVLKGEFKKIDQNDPFAGYRKEPLKSFKYVTLSGKAFGLTQIQQGDKFEVRTTINPEILDWNIVNDTLKVNYKRNWNEAGYNPPNPFDGKPVIYIIAPKLSYIRSSGVTCIVRNWKTEDLTIDQRGNRMLITDNTFGNLSARLTAQGYIQINHKNKIEKAVVTVKDSSAFTTENVFKSFSMQVDSAAHVSLPGNLIKQTTNL